MFLKKSQFYVLHLSPLSFWSWFLYKAKDLGWGSSSCFWIPNGASTICQKVYRSPIDQFLHLCKKSVGHICMSLFLGSLFYPTGLCVHLCANTTALITVPMQWVLKPRILSPLALVFFFKMILAILFSLPFHINFRIILSISTKYLAGILIGKK